MKRIALLFLLAFAPVAFADVESGPKEGEKIAELKALGVIGLQAGKEADFAAERKDEVTVYLFINSETNRMAGVFRTPQGGVTLIEPNL